MSFQPTSGLFETARNVKTFCNENKAHFRKLLIPLLPFLFATGLIQSVPHETTEMKVLFALMVLLQAYLYTMLVVTWHRFTILGPDSGDQEINIFEKKAGVWPYLGFSILIGLIYLGIMLPGIILALVFGSAASKAVVALLVIGLLLVAFYATMRLLIALPSIAINKKLTIKEAFSLSKGMVLRIMFTPLFSAVKPILLAIAYAIFAVIVIVGVSSALNLDKETLDENLGFSIFVYILFCPISLYLQPWMTILGVSSLSNYYLLATQNAAQQPPAQTEALPPV